MAEHRFFVPATAIGDTAVKLPAEVAHHAHKVLRLATGAEIVLLDGSGLELDCRITGLSSRAGQADILDRRQVVETAMPVRMIQGLPKGDKFDLVLQKGTELGVTRFSPAWTERSVPVAKPERMEKRNTRWQRIVAEAARQSRRSRLPECQPVRPLAEVLADTGEELRLMFWEEGSRPLHDVLPAEPPAGVAVLIGPEGGFTSAEADLAVAHGFCPVRLGPRILRSETAGFAVAAVLQYLYGDLGVYNK